MNKLTHAACVLLMLSLAAPAALALGPGFAFGIHANFTSSHFPGPSVTLNGATSSISSPYGAGWGGGVHVDANLMVFSFRLSGDYIHYALDENKIRDYVRPFVHSAADQMTIDGGGLGIISLSVNGKMPVLPLPIITPYITGGVGLAWVTRDQLTTGIPGYPTGVDPSSTQSGKTSIDVGVGVDVKLGIALFLEVKYAWIFTDVNTSTYVPVSIGVTF